jgi:hypothetical protein
MSKVAKLFVAAAAVSVCGIAVADEKPTPRVPGSYLYVWAGDADEQESDFLAVIDANAGSKSYGQVVATVPVGAKATMPHHIEYESPPGTLLFANGWKAGHSFILDLADPLHPRVAADFKAVAGYSYAHSFARLPNGNILATFQATGDKYAGPGALVELDALGKLVRATSSATRDVPAAINWPYSLAVDPGIDRVITTSTDMGLGANWKSPPTHHVQIWSMSDLRLLASVPLPESSQGRHNVWPAEPRLLRDGSVYVNTFTCGLYRLEGLDTAKPSARFVHAFPGGMGEHDMCAVPVVYGKYWIQTVGAINGLVVLDASDPAHPREVSRLSLPPNFHMPHWIAADRSTGRVVATGARDSWVLMLKFDDQTGQLSIDKAFGGRSTEEPGVQFDRAEWPHGKSGKALVHGTVFSR